MRKSLTTVKKHLAENKVTYVACGATAVVASGTTYILASKLGASPEVAYNLAQRAIVVGNYKPTISQTLNLVERSTPSKVVALLAEDGETYSQIFSSMSEASRQTGHALSTLSKHVNGKIPNVKGDVFKIIDLTESVA